MPGSTASGPTLAHSSSHPPEGQAPEDLLTPPAPAQENTGTDSEILVGKILAADGWQVVYYNKRRGYGFDLWAKKNDQAFVVEVKSFTGQASTVTLTSLEFEAARHHGDNFLLVVVEHAARGGAVIHVIQNPLASIRFKERNIAQFSAARADWHPAAAGALPRGNR